MNFSETNKIANNVACSVLIDQEILKVSKQISSIRTADAELSDLRAKWSQVENLRAILAGIFDNFKKKLKNLVPDQILNAWKKVRGVLGKFAGIFNNPKAVKELSKMIGELTPENIKAFLKSGAKAVKDTFDSIRLILTTPSELPTVTDMIKRTAVGARIAEWFTTKVQPRTDVIDDFLKKYIPTFRRVGIAAAFTFIWLNVDELSWELPALVDGFTGNMTLAELIATLPESGLGAISGALFGIGYTIMPYAIVGRLLWMLGRKYLTWDGKKLGVNWDLVDKTLYRNAEKTNAYQMVRI